MKNIINNKAKIEKPRRDKNFSTLNPQLSNWAAGQALVTLIFFMVFATTVTTAAVFVIATNSISGAKFQEGSIAYQIAQSGADNALIRLLRTPTYTGETLSVGSGSATVTVTGTGTVADPFIILSKGQKGYFTKQVQVSAQYIDNELSVISQKEVF